jgi:hypothetical protein
MTTNNKQPGNLGGQEMTRKLGAVVAVGALVLAGGVVGTPAAEANPLCWFGSTGAVAPCGEGYGNGNGQLTPAQQQQQCGSLGRLPASEIPDWYGRTC